MQQWITTFLERTGYLGVALLMFLENVCPPIPSELVMPLAGYGAARGALRLPLVILAGTVGSLLGALPWYFAGRALGAERLAAWAGRHGRWLTIAPADVERSQHWFERHGTKAVLVGRLVPAARTLISVPAGIARMPLPRFLAWSAVGSLAWTAALATAGHALGSQYERVGRYLGPVSNGIIVVLLAVYLWRVARWRGGATG